MTDAILITPTHPRWPAGLYGLGADMPQELWVLGDTSVLTAPAVALTASGASSSVYSRYAAQEMTWHLSKRGTVVVTDIGSDPGRDAARAAIEAGGCPVVYVASALVNPPLPPAGVEPDALIEGIVAAGGAVVSACPPGTIAGKTDRALSGVLSIAHSAAAVIIEAVAGSHLVDAGRASKTMGRVVGAFPGLAGDPCSAGCLELIEDGTAAPVRDTNDLEDLIARA